MKLIFLRHGTAEEKSAKQTELDDFNRELVRKGRKEIKRIVKNNPDVFKNIDVIFTSPLLRALETAQILYDKFPSDMFEVHPLLETHVDPKVFVKSFQIKNDPAMCFVGHEPFLTKAVKLFLKSPDLKIDLVKGGAIVLEGSNLKDLKLSLVIKP